MPHMTSALERNMTCRDSTTRIEPARVRALLGSEPGTLASALDHLDAAYGGAERWAAERAGLGDEELGALREALLA